MVAAADELKRTDQVLAGSHISTVWTAHKPLVPYDQRLISIQNLPPNKHIRTLSHYIISGDPHKSCRASEGDECHRWHSEIIGFSGLTGTIWKALTTILMYHDQLFTRRNVSQSCWKNPDYHISGCGSWWTYTNGQPYQHVIRSCWVVSDFLNGNEAITMCPESTKRVTCKLSQNFCITTQWGVVSYVGVAVGSTRLHIVR